MRAERQDDVDEHVWLVEADYGEGHTLTIHADGKNMTLGAIEDLMPHFFYRDQGPSVQSIILTRGPAPESS